MNTHSILQLLVSCLLLQGVAAQSQSSVGAGLRNVTQVLQLSNGLEWGLWGSMDFCEQGTFAHAFEVKFEPAGSLDDTAVNGVKLYCRTPAGYDSSYVTSVVGNAGDWQGMRVCYEGFLTGLTAEVLEPQGVLHDDIAVMNVEMQCDYNAETLLGVDFDNSTYPAGTWGNWGQCAKNTKVCGLQIRFEEWAVDDDSGTTDIVMFCCEY